MPIDTLKDLAPISSLVSNQFVLSINPKLPPKNFQEFIEYAKKANPPLAYASGGNGSQHQLTMEMLKERAGFDMVHVPYKGGAPATAATMSGEVAALFSGTSSAPQIKAGRIRALAVAADKRSPTFPDLPTIGEFYPGFENSIWLGLFGPAGIPQAALGRLRAELAPDEEMRAGFEATLALHDGLPMPFERARTQLALGERLRRAKQRAEAREPLTAALDAFERLGARPWAERARAELRATGGPAGARRAQAAAQLTPQELQIARFVARGATNREIAADLFISEKTASVHVSNIKSKLGASGRAEIAAIAVRLGLVAETDDGDERSGALLGALR